jgi:hypothetical protein
MVFRSCLLERTRNTAHRPVVSVSHRKTKERNGPASPPVGLLGLHDLPPRVVFDGLFELLFHVVSQRLAEAGGHGAGGPTTFFCQFEFFKPGLFEGREGRPHSKTLARRRGVQTTVVRKSER